MVGVTGSIPVAPTRFAPSGRLGVPDGRGVFIRSGRSRLEGRVGVLYAKWQTGPCSEARRTERMTTMKVRNSLKSLRSRHRDNRIVRRKGRVYIINKTNRRFKARQG